MMLYMKQYAEVLLSWSLTHKAIELCKICSKVDTLLNCGFPLLKPVTYTNSFAFIVDETKLGDEAREELEQFADG